MPTTHAKRLSVKLVLVLILYSAAFAGGVLLGKSWPPSAGATERSPETQTIHHGRSDRWLVQS
jgi:hypothetical protein